MKKEFKLNVEFKIGYDNMMSDKWYVAFIYKHPILKTKEVCHYHQGEGVSELEFLRNAYNFIKDSFLVTNKVEKHAIEVLEKHESKMTKDDYTKAINDMKHNITIRL